MSNELSEILTRIGYRKPVSKVITWFIINRDGRYSSREIERGADLRQPEASLALKDLLKRKWISAETIPGKKEGPGQRRTKRYYLVRSVDGIYTEIAGQVEKAYKENERLIKEIRAFTEVPAMKKEKPNPSESSTDNEGTLV